MGVPGSLVYLVGVREVVGYPGRQFSQPGAPSRVYGGVRTLPGWLNIRTAICCAPVYQEPGSYRGRCMLCDVPTYFHPREPSGQPYGLDGVSWHRLRDGERDQWSDLLEIMTT